MFRFTYLTVLALCLLFSRHVYAAAPDDIADQQRAWFDAVDLNANADYTDNPASGSSVAQWSDKSGSANHISSTGVNQPSYQHDVLATDRHGVDFDGIDDLLNDSDDIWVGSVDEAEVFIVATTDVIKSSFIFASNGTANSRFSSHLPWGNSLGYFDHGPCCGAPNRLQGYIPITLSEGYVWHYIGLPDEQAIVQDGVVTLSDGGSGVYETAASSTFTMGNYSAGNLAHNGRVFESLHYQTSLNVAQRRIVGSYLSAKWSRDVSASADYADVYNGDDASNGHYDFFVGGIGQDGGSQTVGTSQGLTVVNDTFLSSDNKFLVAGVDYLVTTPTIGTSVLDVPASYANRSQRSWYIDTTGTGGLVTLTFDADDIGFPVNDGERHGLLYRSGITGAFTEVATAVMSSGAVSFSHLPTDGVYVLGLAKKEVELSMTKMVDNMSPNVGDSVTFTLIVSNAGPDDSVDAFVSDVLPAGFASPITVSNDAGSVLSIVGNVIDWTGISVPVGGAATAVFTAEVLPP